MFFVFVIFLPHLSQTPPTRLAHEHGAVGLRADGLLLALATAPGRPLLWTSKQRSRWMQRRFLFSFVGKRGGAAIFFFLFRVRVCDS